MSGGSVTQDDVAPEAGVSRASVSMALAGSPRVAEATRARIVAVAARLGYSRDLAAATLAKSSSEILGMVFPNLRNPFFEEFMEAVQLLSEEHQLLLLLATASNDTRREVHVINHFRELRAQGVITMSPAIGSQELRSLGEHLPLVVMGEVGIGGCVDSMTLNEMDAANQIINHLKSKGWEAMAYVCDPSLQRDSGLVRRRGFLDSCASAGGMAFDAYEVNGGVTDLVRDVMGSGQGKRLAFVGHNDFLAAEIASAARGEGLVVGRDVGIVGYDNTHLSTRSQADLTSVAQPTAEMAVQAMDWIRTRSTYGARQARERIFPAKLVVRAST